MSMGKLFQTHWLDYVVEGHPIKEWCQCIKHETTRARCTYCNVAMKFDINGLTTFKRHALSKKHKENRRAAHLRRKKDADFSGEYIKPQETIDALALLYPGMNFNCSVDLLPLSVICKASKRASNSDLVSLLRHLIKSETRNAFIDVYICFYCGDEFVSRPALHGHQKGCGLKPADFQPLVHIGKPSLHQYDSITPPSRLSPENISTLATTKGQAITPYVLPSKDTYISGLGLLPKKKVAHVCNRRRNTECEIIDLDEDIPISPSIPRTPKRLLSHLSRDGNENGGDNTALFKVKKSLFGFHHNSQTGKETNARIESYDESNETENTSKEKGIISRTKSLYSLDITSPLGQLVIKHFKGDPNLHVLSDVESHCLTSTPKKSAPAIQLRERHHTYPVTFKGFFAKFNCSYEHQYKFTRNQKVEFLRRVNTGLDKRSRSLLRKMKRCTVRLTHITKSDLKRWKISTDEVTVDLKPLSVDEIYFWTSPKPFVDINSNNAAVFPSGLTFSSPNVNNVLGLKTCMDTASHNKYNLSVANYVSEETSAEVTVNRRTIYKSLLSDSAGCDSCLVQTACSQVSTPTLKKILASPCVRTRTVARVHTPLEHANITVTAKNMSSPPLHNNQTDNSNRKKGNDSCNLLSSVYRYTNNAKSTDSSVSSNLSNCSNQNKGIALTEREKGEVVVGPSRSGIYNVQIRTALEGGRINCSIQNLKPALSNPECASTPEISRTRKRKFGDIQNALKKTMSMSNGRYIIGLLKNDCVKNAGILKSKKRKLENVIKKADSSVTSANPNKGSAVSRVKFPDSQRTLPAKVATDNRAEMIKDAFARYTLCPELKKNSNTALLRQVEPPEQQPGNCSILVERFDGQHKPRITSKPVGSYKTFASVGSFRNNSLLMMNKGLSPQKNTISCSVLHANEHQEDKNVTLHGKPLYSPKLVPNETSSRVTNDSFLKKFIQIPLLNNTAEVSEEKIRDNKNAMLYTTDSRSKTSVQEAPKSLLQRSTFPNPLHVSWKDSTRDSKLISQKDIPINGLKFLTNSPPISFSPQLRQSSLTNTVSIARKAEIRKSHLTSFLLKPNRKSLGTLLIKNSLSKSRKHNKHKQRRVKLRQSSASARRK